MFNGIFASVGYPAVGVIKAGGFPLAYRGQSFDMLGLNDVRMAHATRDRWRGFTNHAAFNAAVFYERGPDIVVTNGGPCDLKKPVIRMRND